MNTTATAARSTQRPPRRRSLRAAVATSVVPLGTAVAVVAVMLAAGSPAEGVVDVAVSAAFVGWNLLPVAGATVLLLWSGRRGWLPYAGAALGCVALALVTADALHDFWTSDSSTAALMFLFLPVIQWGVVALTVGLVALGVWRDRRVSSSVGRPAPAHRDASPSRSPGR